MLVTVAIASLASLASLIAAEVSGCERNGGSFAVSNLANVGVSDRTLGAHSATVIANGDGQICIVNRAPSTNVFVNSGQFANARNAILSTCCGGVSNCRGGQFKITADSGNVIDLSLQQLGHQCQV